MRTIEIDLQSNQVVIAPAPDRELDLAAIPAAIRAAGFQPADLRIRARGSFDAGQPGCFRIRGWSQCYPARGERQEAASGELAIDAAVEIDGKSVVMILQPPADA